MHNAYVHMHNVQLDQVTLGTMGKSTLELGCRMSWGAQFVPHINGNYKSTQIGVLYMCPMYRNTAIIKMYS